MKDPQLPSEPRGGFLGGGEETCKPITSLCWDGDGILWELLPPFSPSLGSQQLQGSLHGHPLPCRIPPAASHREKGHENPHLHPRLPPRLRLGQLPDPPAKSFPKDFLLLSKQHPRQSLKAAVPAAAQTATCFFIIIFLLSLPCPPPKRLPHDLFIPLHQPPSLREGGGPRLNLSCNCSAPIPCCH